MLEPAARGLGREYLEQVIVERHSADGCAAEQIDLALRETREVTREAFEIAAMPPADGDVMACAAGLEMREHEAAHLDRMIDQLVVVCGGITAKAVRLRAASRQAGRKAPVVARVAHWSDDLDVAGPFLVFDEPDEYRWSVKIATGLVRIRGAHRQIKSVGLGDQEDRTDARGHLPNIPGRLANSDRGAGAFGPYVHKMACEFADQITSGSPGR